MTKRTNTISANRSHVTLRRNKGAALLVTLAVLVILTTLVYSLQSRLTTYKRRQSYMINYQVARYACDSAMKYALIKAKDIKPELATRQDSPDFSDLFFLNHEQEQEMLEEWAIIKTEELNSESLENEDENPLDGIMGAMSNNDTMGNVEEDGEFNDPNGLSEFSELSGLSGLSGFGRSPGLREDGSVDPNSLSIPGPYGADWPYISEPLNFMVGNTIVTVKIRDENAKMPLTWGIMNNAKEQRAAEEAILTFCQWMQMDDLQIENLMQQLEEVKKQKPYSKNLKPIVTYEKTQQKVSTPARSTSRSSRSSRASSSRRTTPRTRTVTKKITRPGAGHTSDFARLLHSSLIDTSALSVPLPDTGKRQETALKYMALWGSQKVNINTAPRLVLEAVFTFGGDQEEIADKIIEQRQLKPYKDIKDFKQQNYGFSDSIKKVEPYIITKSTFFAIEVTAYCGNAVVSSVATVIIDKGKANTVGIMTN